eukprot:1884408-Lingulodinium_polyedra.AAC.1
MRHLDARPNANNKVPRETRAINGAVLLGTNNDFKAAARLMQTGGATKARPALPVNGHTIEPPQR